MARIIQYDIDGNITLNTNAKTTDYLAGEMITVQVEKRNSKGQIIYDGAVPELIADLDNEGELQFTAGEPIMIESYDEDNELILDENEKPVLVKQKDTDGNIVMINKEILMKQAKDIDGNLLWIDGTPQTEPKECKNWRDADGNYVGIFPNTLINPVMPESVNENYLKIDTENKLVIEMIQAEKDVVDFANRAYDFDSIMGRVYVEVKGDLTKTENLRDLLRCSSGTLFRFYCASKDWDSLKAELQRIIANNNCSFSAVEEALILAQLPE